MSNVETLKKYAEAINIAPELDEEQLISIGRRVLRGYEEDKKSMSEWLADVKKIEDLASLRSIKKTRPLPNSANIKLPLITKACYEFSSSTLPEIIKDDKIAAGKILGEDDDGAKAAASSRALDYMNYQLLFEDDGQWQAELDQLLTRLALIGFLCKKQYYDPIKQRICSTLCDYNKLFIHSDAKSLEDAPRISEILNLRLNDFIEGKNSTDKGDVSVFLEKTVDELVELHKADELDKPIEVIEQHCKLDLDKDGYAEPYIVTIVKDSAKVLRVVARYSAEGIQTARKGKVRCIKAKKYYTDYHFLVNPKGKFQSVGFGLILLHLNEACNSTANQLMDSSQLANLQGGYKDARLEILGDAESLHDPGEWKDIRVMTGGSLSDGMMPINYKEPSNVMYQLLGFLTEVARDLTASAQINNGTQSSANAKTGATMLLQEAGKKMSGAIKKRIYRSLTNELRQIFLLNAEYLDDREYREAVGKRIVVKSSDFDPNIVSVCPVADPSLSSESERLQQAAFVQSMQMAPGVDPIKATKFILTKTNIPGIMDILADPKQKPPPSPDILKLQAEMEKSAQELNIDGERLEIERHEASTKAALAKAQILQYEANAIALLAKAGSEQQATSLESIRHQFEVLKTAIDTQLEQDWMAHEKEMQERAAQQAPPAGGAGAQPSISEAVDGLPTEPSIEEPSNESAGSGAMDQSSSNQVI